MSNDIEITDLPADPEETSQPKPTSWDEALAEVTGDVQAGLDKYVDVPEVLVPTAPSVGIDAQGVPTVTVPLTKKTKAIVSGVGSTVTAGATAALAILGPDTTEAHILTIIVAVVGIIGTTFGTHQVTNLPDTKKAAKHVTGQ